MASDFLAYEIIVVDDGSTDESAAACRALGIEVLPMASRSGPAAARNHGARHARGSVLLFVDADVAVHRDTLARAAAFLNARPEIAAVFGSYDDAPAEVNFVSQYKNLVHHFVHQQSSPEASTFWAGCGAVRREAFAAVGGFDAARYARPYVEDIELGYRLRRAGFAIALDREMQVKHLKRWTLPSLWRTDIFSRALPWSRLILEQGGMINDLNLRMSGRISAALVGLAVALSALSLFAPGLLFVALAALMIVLLLDLGLLRFLAKRRGMWFAARACAMQLLYYFYSGAAFAFSYVGHVFRKPFVVPADRSTTEAETSE
jgi:GT2 family glycosyltransferase